LLPIPIPASVQHERSQAGSRSARRCAPLHAAVLLPPGDDQIVGLLHMGAAEVLTGDTPLTVVRDPASPRLQLGDQVIQVRLALRRSALRFQHHKRSLDVTTP
jgi:hypothetical protein